MQTVDDLIDALVKLRPKAEIDANHGTTKLYVKDDTGRFREFFSFKEETDD